MTGHELVAASLLALAIALAWLSVFGLAVMRNPFDRLHAIAPLSILPPSLIVIAILTRKGFSAASVKLFVIVLVMIASGPVLTHAMARAARIREEGKIAPQEE